MDTRHYQKWIKGFGFDEPLSDGNVMHVTTRKTASPIDAEPYRKILRSNDDAESPKTTSTGYKYGSYESLLNSSDSFVGEVWYSLHAKGDSFHPALPSLSSINLLLLGCADYWQARLPLRLVIQIFFFTKSIKHLTFAGRYRFCG